MPAIFYDLETSDREPIGQILNYCFLAVDYNLKVFDEESGGVAISRLQLPSPSAIAANRIDVLQHQQAGYPNEMQAMERIVEFISRIIENAKGQKVELIGYNSSRFDLPFLRSSLIRNGLNPYFSGKLAYRDLLQLSRKLYATVAEFPRVLKGDRFSLALETLTQHFGLLQGAQAHESRADVELTIDLAKLYRERYDAEVIKFDAYEGAMFHALQRKPVVLAHLQPAYDPSSELRAHTIPVTLLEAGRSGTLWVDLVQYASGVGRAAVRWVGPAKDQWMMLGKESAATELAKNTTNDWQALAANAQQEFLKLNLNNFFKDSVCDIDQDIYRLDFDDIDALHAAIWNGEVALCKEPAPAKDGKKIARDRRVTFLRHQLANHRSGLQDPSFRKQLASYAMYRYGGQANIRKSEELLRYQDGAPVHHFHPNLQEMLRELNSIRNRDQGDSATIALMNSLERYYRESEIWQVAGEELMGVGVREMKAMGAKTP